MSSNDKSQEIQPRPQPINLLDNRELLNRVLDVLFMPLSQVKDVRHYDLLFCNRDEDLRTLQTLMETMSETGRNILIVGDAGSGKTSFIRRVLRVFSLEKTRYHAAFVDLRKNVHAPPGGSVAQFATRKLVDELQEYFQTINQPAPVGSLTTSDQVNQAYYLCYTHLNRLDRKLIAANPLYLFIDDIDYTEKKNMPELLSVLSPLIESSNAVVILAARPPVERAIYHYEDTRIRMMFARADQIVYLHHLDVDFILTARLSSILKADEPSANTHPNLLSFFRATFRPDPLREFLKQQLINAEEFLPLEYPFTRRQLSLIQNLSNGNVRTMFSMARRYLLYMCAHRSELENSQHLNLGKTGIYTGRDSVFEMFYADDSEAATRERLDASARIVDLNQRRSHGLISRVEQRRRGIPKQQVGNSLCVVLLETLQRHAVVDDSFFELMDSYGFSKADVCDGLRLLNEEYEMIEERCIRDIGAQVSKGERPSEYLLKKKGHYYVNYLIHWKQYRSRFGESNHHRTLNLNQIRDIRTQVMDLVLHIWQVVGRDAREFKIAKRNFYELFILIHGAPYTRLLPDNTETAIVTEEDFCQIIIDINIVQQRDPVDRRFLIFQTSKFADGCKHAGIQTRLLNPGSAVAFRDFVSKYVVVKEAADGRDSQPKEV